MPELVHWARVPKVEPGQRLPVVVMVHGWQGNEKVMSIFERTVPAGVVVVSPRAPLEVGADSYGWFRPERGEADFPAGLAALSDFVRALPDDYPADPKRILLMGFSQGTAMSYSLLLAEPALIMGVAGLAGFLPAPARAWLAPDRLAGKPVFMAHGTADETLPLWQAQAARNDLAGAGANVAYHEYEGVGHKLNAQGVRDLTRWLAAELGGSERP